MLTCTINVTLISWQMSSVELLTHTTAVRTEHRNIGQACPLSQIRLTVMGGSGMPVEWVDAYGVEAFSDCVNGHCFRVYLAEQR